MFCQESMVLRENQILVLDIDECESDDNFCDKSKETCENSDGSYICNCVGGYRKLNQQCNGKHVTDGIVLLKKETNN